MPPAAQPARRRRRSPLVLVAIFVAAIALILHGPLRGTFLSFAIAFFTLFLVMPALVWVYAVKSIGSRTCPACASATLGRVSVEAFGLRYFRCSSCGARFKRGPLGGMIEAKGPIDAGAFSSGTQADPLAPDEDDFNERAPGPESLVRLVRSKRERQGDNA